MIAIDQNMARAPRTAPKAPNTANFITIPITFMRGNLLTIEARIGRVPVKAIIDTGGEVTIANFAARDALIRNPWNPVLDMIAGATTDMQPAERYPTPPIIIGNIAINTTRTSFGDLHIFQHWDLTEEPAILIGMDALGLLDTLIIDYVARGTAPQDADLGEPACWLKSPIAAGRSPAASRARPSRTSPGPSCRGPPSARSPGISSTRPLFTRLISRSSRPSSGGLRSSSAELIASSVAWMRSRPADGL